MHGSSILRILDIRNSIPNQQNLLKIEPRSSKIALGNCFRIIFIEQERPRASKSVPKASKSVPRASQERLRSAQERAKSDPRAVWASLCGCIWLHVVACGGSPAALGGRWRGGGEVNLSVNDHQAVFIQYLAALRRGAGGFSSLREDRRPPSSWR